MTRLTRKFKTDYYFNTDNRDIVEKDIENDSYAAQAMRNKLGKLEDIEEELGIDLITLFKVMKSDDGIWVNGEYVPQLQFLLAAFKEPGQKIFRYPYGPHIGYFEDRETKEQHFGFKIYNYFVSIKDYGKAWALDKKELTSE